jgi:hypothetical protein
MLCLSLFVLLYFFFWSLCCLFFIIRIQITLSGADPGFQVRGGALKKIAPSKKSYFFQLRREVRVFRVKKNHDFTPKNHIFSNFRGGARRVRLPLDPPMPLVSSNSSWNALITMRRRRRQNSVILSFLN